jgi:hypothetical protein
MFTEQLTQALSVADVLNQQSVNNASVASVGIDMQKFHRVLFVVQAASLGAAGTLDGRLQSCTQSNFASAVHNIANTNLTQINTSTTPGNNAVATLEIRADQVEQANSGDRYLRLQLTGGGNAITVGALGLGAEANHKPGNAQDVSNTYLSQRVVAP